MAPGGRLIFNKYDWYVCVANEAILRRLHGEVFRSLLGVHEVLPDWVLQRAVG